MRLDVVSIFPDYLAPLDLSLIGKACRDGLLDLQIHDLRNFTHDRHRTVDDTPFGGGAGMVMKPEPWAEALESVVSQGKTAAYAVPRLIVPGPGGVPFTQALAHELAAEPWLAFACGRYEGIDERVYEHAAERMPVTIVSLGDYVLNGGEVAVLAMVEAVARLLPGVIGNAESLVEESHEDGLLEYPVYTKPATWIDGGTERAVPEVLLSGNHAAIAAWRHQQRLERTAARRPDLLHASQALPAITAGEGLDGLAGLDMRLATPADAPELLVLTRACWLPEVADTAHLWGGPQESLEEHVAALSDWQTYAVRSAGRLIASVRCRVSPDDPLEWQIGRLMVAPDLEGRGLGRALLAFAESLAPESTRTIWLNTGRDRERNLKLYRKAGYRPLAGESRVHPATVDLTKPRRARKG
jgi:tRNA (guanine37-N1)-methyltransferase